MLNFPSSPSVGQTFSSGNIIYTWNGLAWTSNGGGVQGIQGITGAQGTTGSQGTTGTNAPRTINFVISGGGATITTGTTEAAQSKGYIFVSEALNIAKWQLFANTSGSIKIDVWTGAYGGSTSMPTMNMISGTNPPQLAAAQANSGSNTGWTTAAIAAGNVIQFRVNSAVTVSVDQVTVAMNCA